MFAGECTLLQRKLIVVPALAIAATRNSPSCDKQRYRAILFFLAREAGITGRAPGSECLPAATTSVKPSSTKYDDDSLFGVTCQEGEQLFGALLQRNVQKGDRKRGPGGSRQICLIKKRRLLQFSQPWGVCQATRQLDVLLGLQIQNAWGS